METFCRDIRTGEKFRFEKKPKNTLKGCIDIYIVEGPNWEGSQWREYHFLQYFEIMSELETNMNKYNL